MLLPQCSSVEYDSLTGGISLGRANVSLISKSPGWMGHCTLDSLSRSTSQISNFLCMSLINPTLMTTSAHAPSVTSLIKCPVRVMLWLRPLGLLGERTSKIGVSVMRKIVLTEWVDQEKVVECSHESSYQDRSNQTTRSYFV